MRRALRVALLAGAASCALQPAAGQTPSTAEVARMSIEDLLRAEVVSTASKFPQEVREAPASVTIITAADIRRYGYRNLADILRSVRGFYASYDRNYAYVGVRGISRPGDYNTRVLLLLDGNRLNDSVYHQAPVGTDLPIDLSLIEKVEIIRGPASSLYGTNAFLGVINIVTRTGAQHPGARAELYGGSLRTGGGVASYGRVLQSHAELLLAGSHYYSGGPERLFYPEYTSDLPGSGTAVNQDGERISSAFASFATKRLSFRLGATDRFKHIPTGAWGSVFGDDRFTTVDRRVFASAAYDGPVGRGWLATVRLAYSFYLYDARFPLDEGGDEPVLFLDRGESHMGTFEITARKRMARIHLLSVGTEVRRDFHDHQKSRYDGGPLVLDVADPALAIGAYVQDEVRVYPWMLLNAGLRLDRYQNSSSNPAPRLGVVLLPRKQTAVKILHGRAFRAPNSYELYYYDVNRDHLRPLESERIQSTEVVWEEYLSGRVRTSVSAFTLRAKGLIELRADGGESIEHLYYANTTALESTGVEAELEARLPGGLNGSVKYTHVRTGEIGRHGQLSNSPRHLAKLGVQVPVSEFHVSADVQYVGERLTLRGEALKAFVVPNVTVTSPEGRRLAFSASLYNAIDRLYADPGAEEHLQDSIAQDGRTFLARLRIRF